MFPTSTFDRASEFLKKAEDLGLIAEIDQRIEERNQEQRLELIAKLKSLPTEEEAGLPKLAKAAEDAALEFQRAEARLTEARQKLNHAQMQCYGASLQFEGRRTSLEREIYALAPVFLQEAIRDIGWLGDKVAQRVRFVVNSRWSFFGIQKEEVSNADQIATLRAEITGVRKRFFDMLLEPMALHDMEHEVKETCARILKRSIELGVDEREFNARHQKKEPVVTAETIRKATQERRSLELTNLTI